MTRLTLGLGLFLVVGTAIACSSSSNTTGTGGAAGTSTGGNAGTSAGGTGGGGGTSAGGTGGGTAGFMSILPCPADSDYSTDAGTGATVSFGGTVGFFYEPKCLKVSAGATVTFSGDFSSHPLQPSSVLGNTTNNPIAVVSALPDGGTMTSFTFPNKGFYAYRCSFHGSDDGMFMSGVIWVQ